MHEGVDIIREQKTKNNENHDKTPSPQKSPIGGPPLYLRREVLYSSCRGLCVMGLGPPGKAMTVEVVAAPAPGSLNNIGLVEGAVGGGCPSPDKAQPSVEEGVRRFFCDVHRRAKNGEGYRITFTMDGVTFRHVDSFTDIPTKEGDKIYIDTIPLTHTDDAIRLLKRGVELYCLRRLTLVEKKREELKLPKTTKGDIKTLMSLEERWFRKLSEDFLTMRRLISVHRSLLKTHQQLENKRKAVSEDERNILKPAIKALEEQMDEMAKQITGEAGRRYPVYNKLVEEFGIDGSLQAMEALAELMTYIDITYSWTKIRNYLGLWHKDRKTRYHKSKTARQALERLTIVVKGYGIKGRDLDEVLKTIWLTLKTQKTSPPA
jgi:hypothetical protein